MRPLFPLSSLLNDRNALAPLRPRLTMNEPRQAMLAAVKPATCVNDTNQNKCECIKVRLMYVHIRIHNMAYGMRVLCGSAQLWHAICMFGQKKCFQLLRIIKAASVQCDSELNAELQSECECECECDCSDLLNYNATDVARESFCCYRCICNLCVCCMLLLPLLHY